MAIEGNQGDAGSEIAGVYNQKYGCPGSSSKSWLVHDASEQAHQQTLHPGVILHC